MKQLKIAAVAALALVLTACGQKVTAGEVVDKEFEPAHSYIYYVWYRTGNAITPHAMVGHTSDCWTVEIFGEVDGEETTSTYEVTEEVYNSLEIGDWYDAEG